MRYTYSLDDISADMLEGFFVGWPNKPSMATHLKLLQSSSHIVLALDDKKQKVVGFITAISDGILSAYIPFLEVLPDYQNNGIGKVLVEKMFKELEDLYMIDLCCDDALVPYYEKIGMNKVNGMSIRHYQHQSGEAHT
ncbi:GNAT family N-acetyltransferase [Gracilibacillus sp. S3-1-1]|uniref:GNAT family N-acetyltransferase n=1 Tax=Gracilibacillus pellucidus TaxID=3095368 RepID=A0ACC6M7G8_9BACI|nr:GNAT family N-acetyltransferase [Gracilibacillus sp. S3-1-1]MDX8046838.1 GNAT family N-acetyltransferase [Gracilibacillus sp. S3-1-1]